MNAPTVMLNAGLTPCAVTLRVVMVACAKMVTKGTGKRVQVHTVFLGYIDLIS